MISIKEQVSAMITAAKVEQCVTTSQHVLNLHRLDDDMPVVCRRLLTHLERQGVPTDQGFCLSMCMRVIEIFPKKGRHVLTVLAPVYCSLGSQLHTTVVIKISVPSEDQNGQLQVFRKGMYLQVNPLWIWDFDLPRTEFRVDRFEVIDYVLINPFDYVDYRDLGAGVYRSTSNQVTFHKTQGELITLVGLISVLASLCRFMKPEDLRLLDTVIASSARMRQFLTQPASTNSHHNHRHGLLLHTVETCLQVLILLASKWSEITRILSEDPSSERHLKYSERHFDWASGVAQGIACGVLHDFGKIGEYEDLGNGAYALSDSGLFLGHQLKVCLWVYHAAMSSEYSDHDRLLELIHCLSAVDRQHDQSGLRSRKTFIAKIVNQADRLSAGHRGAFVHEFHSWLTGDYFGTVHGLQTYKQKGVRNVQQA